MKEEQFRYGYRNFVTDYIMDEEMIHQLNDRLMNGEITVTFTKADGTERVMRCTKNFDMIPVDQHPAEHDPIDYVDLMKVFDLDVGAWRSFKPSRIISYE